MDDNTTDFIGIAAGLVAAYVSNNHVQAAELPALIVSAHGALVGLGKPAQPEEAPVEPLTAAQVRKSITPDALISFVDGKPYKTLRRHLTTHGLTPETYRRKFGLPADYPLTAPRYSEQRSALAKQLGLGRPGGMAPVQQAAE